MKEKLKLYKLVGVSDNNQERSIVVGKLKQRGLAHNAYWSKGYCRKDGTWVSSHYRNLEPSKKINLIKPQKTDSNDPNQLTFNF